MSSQRWSLVGKIYMAATIVVLGLMEIGCLAIPTKLPNRFRGTAGVRLQESELDFTFIEVGATRREEVANRLAALDAGSPRQFFWGRWTESSWGMVGAGATGSDLDPVAGFAERHWHFRNLLVKFDEQGIVREKIIIDDGETLWNQLLAYSRNSPEAPTPELIRIIPKDKKYTEIVLSADSIEFRGAKPESNMIFHFPRPMVIRLRPQFLREVQRPEFNCYALQIEDASVGIKRKADFCESGQMLARVVRYLDRIPVPARWEGK